jgi:hypothetical protein
MKYFAALAVLILATITAHAMGFMLSVTGPYNSSCSIFVEGKPAERALALAYAQGFFAALNEGNPPVNLQARWRELNAYIVRNCTDKSNPYLYRRFVSDFVSEALDEMRKPTFTPPMMGAWCKQNGGEEDATTYVRGDCPNSHLELTKHGWRDDANACQAVASEKVQDGILVTAKCDPQDFLFTLRGEKLVIKGSWLP